MAETSIEWTDATWNPIVGCSIASRGCANCYAAVMAKRLRAMALADIKAGRNPSRKRYYIDAVDDNGRWTGKLIPVPEALADPLKWRGRKLVFVNSMSDLFHENVPNEFIANVFATMYEARWHTFQVLSKRADRLSILTNPRFPFAVGTLAWNRMSPEKQSILTVDDVIQDVMDHWPLPNVWIGVSCEDQQRANERIPHLLKCPAAVRFLSCEPLLGPIDLTKVGNHDGTCANLFDGNALYVGDIGGVDFAWTPRGFLNWCIVGGESGRHSRPCRATWIRDLVRQCADAKLACFVKQLGANAEEGFGVNRKLKLSDPKGGDMAEWPEDLRVRQFPEVHHA